MSKEFSKLHIRKMPIAQYPRYTQTTSTSNRTSLELKLRIHIFRQKVS